MTRFIFPFLLSLLCLYAYGQRTGKSLPDYVEAAKQYSPLLHDYRNQLQIEQAELRRLKALYTRSRLELNGDYLFVPVLTKDGGTTSFRWNAQDATDYYGYDLGESSGHLHAGATWTQPLLGHSSYKVAQEQSRINMDMARNHIRLEENQLERAVTEQYRLDSLNTAASLRSQRSMASCAPNSSGSGVLMSTMSAPVPSSIRRASPALWTALTG